MAEQNDIEDAGAEAELEASEQAQTDDGAGWSNIWQVPTLLLGMAVFVLGVYLALPEPEQNQYMKVLEEVALYVKARNPDQAQRLLEDKLEPNIGGATRPEQATYYLLWGDLVYLQQDINRWDKPENHQRVLRYYQRAQDLGLSLGPAHLQRLAETYVALKRDTEAMEIIAQLKDASAQRRYMVIRRIIERRLHNHADAHELAPLMARFDDELRQETNKQARREQEMWSVGVQAEGLMGIDEVEKSIEYLQRQMIHFMAEGGDEDLAPLRVLLAGAFQRLGEHEQAQRWYRLAQQKLDTVDPLNARVLVGLGQLDLAMTGDVRAALENFSVAEAEYPTAPSYIHALIGRADCEARLGSHPEAIEHFGQAVKIVTKDLRWSGDDLGRLVDPIHGHFELNVERQDFSLALDYLSLLKPVYRDEMPPRLLLEFAVTYEQIAERRLAEYKRDNLMADEAADDGSTDDGMADGDVAGPARPSPAQVRLVMQAAAARYANAAQYYFDHAHAVTGDDDEAYGLSLWSSAVNYDKAELWDKAIEVYTEFIKTRPDDPLQLEAINHLGGAYQSSGQHPTAADLFKRLVEEHPNTPEAYKSLVPLARSHVAMGENDAAERVLLYVVTSHPAITPSSMQYQEAVVELGKLYYQTHKYEDAIARLTEAVDRYGQTRLAPTLRFRLADTYRRSIQAIDSSLGEPLPHSKVVVIRSEKARRLEQAQVLFSQVISELEGEPAAAMEPLEKLYLRNAYFYRADCAYDLGRYEQAISLYDLAAKRWEAHPASLVALVQIVNAYCELGKTQEAKVANDRARWQLKRIPDEAFNDPTLPMTREHWQDWLRWTSELNLFGTQASASGGAALP